MRDISRVASNRFTNKVFAKCLVSPRVLASQVIPLPASASRRVVGESRCAGGTADGADGAEGSARQRLHACSPLARLSTTEPPFCHSLPPFSAVNLRFGHASFVGKMCVRYFLLTLVLKVHRASETRSSFKPLNIFVLFYC